MTARDTEVLLALARYRFLRTGQIKRLCFADTRDCQVARRRLKYLFHHGHVGRIAPFVKEGQGEGEIAYYLDALGFRTIERELDGPLPYTLLREDKRERARTSLNHALAVSEFRVNVECALRGFDRAELDRFTADFELKRGINSPGGHHRFETFDELIHPVTREKYAVYPDAVMVLRGTGESANRKRLYFVEIDLGTEGLETIRRKLIGYRLCRAQGRHQRYGGFEDFRLLVQTTNAKRRDNIRRIALETDERLKTLVAVHGDASDEELLTSRVWIDPTGDAHAILRR